jgi:hypothetical protein
MLPSETNVALGAPFPMRAEGKGNGQHKRTRKPRRMPFFVVPWSEFPVPAEELPGLFLFSDRERLLKSVASESSRGHFNLLLCPERTARTVGFLIERPALIAP